MIGDKEFWDAKEKFHKVEILAPQPQKRGRKRKSDDASQAFLGEGRGSNPALLLRPTDTPIGRSLWARSH